MIARPLTLAPVGYWLPVRDGDPRVRALFLRHYSARKNRDWWADKQAGWKIAGPGEVMALLTVDCSAVWIWRRERFRLDGQRGVNCAVFRNEGGVLSSLLVREASELAWLRWPGERLFTFVDGAKVRSSNPGYCYLMAGWRRCGTTKVHKLVILECLPEWAK